MNEIVIFTQENSVTYAAIYIAIGAVAAFVCSVLTAVMTDRKFMPVMACGALSVVIAPIFARVVYWYCRPEQFSGFGSVLQGMNRGGYSMVGVFIGVLLSACLVRLFFITNDLPSLLDCISPGAALGIAIGRMGGYFTDDDKGNFIYTDSQYQRLPFSVLVQDSTTNSGEWRFASFFWEAMAAFAIFALLLAAIIIRSKFADRYRKGGVFMAFISLYGATQAMLESTRYDALHMRSNGFVSMMQMTALIMLLFPFVFYLVAAIRSKVSLGRIIPCGVLTLAALVGAGVAEYFVQRKANESMKIYPIQLLLLLTACAMTAILSIRPLSPRSETEPAATKENSVADNAVASVVRSVIQEAVQNAATSAETPADPPSAPPSAQQDTMDDEWNWLEKAAENGRLEDEWSNL